MNPLNEARDGNGAVQVALREWFSRLWGFMRSQFRNE